MSDIIIPLLMNQNPPREDEIAIDVYSLSDLFINNDNYIFKIPEYQRPYIWDEEKISALVKDLKDFYENQKEETHYYMGTILFHKKENSLNIIDGQQRITTLLIIDYILNNENSILESNKDNFNLFYNSPISKENIIKNRDYIKSNLYSKIDKNLLTNFCNDIILSVIITTSADEAFTFFDSQNNRGISLSSVDFLKSYHLKAIKGDSEESEKQACLAKKWDQNNANQFLDNFFNLYLWRIRNWKGSNVSIEDKDEILNEFQKRTKPKETNNSIRLFSNVKNKFASSLDYSLKNGIQIKPQPITIQIKAKDYPFSIRQPIQKGIGFFLFADKYFDLYRFIFQTKHEKKSDLYLLNEFYNEVYKKCGLSEYLTNFFKICVLLYYDKFEEEKLYDFVLWLDHLIGSYRIKQKSIVVQTPIRIIRDKSQNLLDVIESSYLPDDVISFIKSITNKTDYETEVNGNGVQGSYKQALISYYNNGSILTEKNRWINERLKEK